MWGDAPFNESESPPSALWKLNDSPIASSSKKSSSLFCSSSDISARLCGDAPLRGRDATASEIIAFHRKEETSIAHYRSNLGRYCQHIKARMYQLNTIEEDSDQDVGDELLMDITDVIHDLAGMYSSQAAGLCDNLTRRYDNFMLNYPGIYSNPPSIKWELSSDSDPDLGHKPVVSYPQTTKTGYRLCL